jgi:hypothetical protein
MNKAWKPVKDGLPDDGERVLVWLAFVNDFDLATYNKAQKSWKIEGKFKSNKSQITHWKRVDTSKVDDPNKPGKGMIRIVVEGHINEDYPIEDFPELVTMIAEKSGEKESEIYMRIIRPLFNQE